MQLHLRTSFEKAVTLKIHVDMQIRMDMNTQAVVSTYVGISIRVWNNDKDTWLDQI